MDTHQFPDRYSRQVQFSGIGREGQAKLAAAHVAVVGVGALGAFHAGALARAGVGRLTLIDRDYVEANNLQRQWLFEESDAVEALPKAEAAARHLAKINSEVSVQAVVTDLTPGNVEELLSEADLILDGTDNFETRYLMNDFAVWRNVPWIYGAAVGSYGLAMLVEPSVTCCFKCIYPEPPSGVQPTCETAGVVNTVTALVASWQVSLALRFFVDGWKGAPRKIFTVDVWKGETRQVQQPGPQPDCPACGLRQLLHLEGKKRRPVSLCGRNAVQIHERERPLDLAELESRLRPLGAVRRNEFALRFFLPSYELTIFADGRAIIKGTQDVGVARSLYAKYVGA
ncbi:MAG: ThiF family adenylyltransferase [Bryobacteraceae bacterium]|nr:ThiF family adenylyltransferase [Bryobacteraceae bacterium]MDW8378853.1 ThiF family adenylyltransferase [Bryobacterales bacterium]